MRLVLLAVVLLVFSSGCSTRTKIIAQDVELGTQSVQAKMESPWPFKSSALQICIEPTSAYTRQPIDMLFQGADGLPIRPLAVLTSQGREPRTLKLSRMYIDHNLACFSVHRDLAETYEVVELTADHPILVDRAYWYWFFFH